MGQSRGTPQQTTGFVESPSRLLNLHWMVPDFKTRSRRQKTAKVDFPEGGSDGPMHLLVDGVGKGSGEGR